VGPRFEPWWDHKTLSQVRPDNYREVGPHFLSQVRPDNYREVGPQQKSPLSFCDWGLFFFLAFRFGKGCFSISISLPFHFHSSSFWRQKEGKTARLTQLRLKRKTLPLHPQNSPGACWVLARSRVMLPSFFPIVLHLARTVAAADTTGSFFFPSERPTCGR
jgi:hypothetical protein